MGIDWTANDAREAEPGPETDAKQPLVERQQISRDANGAHRAREWLRGQGIRVSMNDYGDRVQFRALKEPTEDGDRSYCRKVGLAGAPAEHLATARLILLLAAEGVIPVDGGG